MRLEMRITGDVKWSVEKVKQKKKKEIGIEIAIELT